MKKVIVLGITGSIAAYKGADLCSQLVKAGHDVHVIMTKSAMQLVTPLVQSYYPYFSIVGITASLVFEAFVPMIAATLSLRINCWAFSEAIEGSEL